MASGPVFILVASPCLRSRQSHMLALGVAGAHIGKDEVMGHILREIEEWLVEREGTEFLSGRKNR